MYLKKLLLLLILSPLCFVLQAQDEPRFAVDGRLTSDDGKTDGATVSISKNGQAEELSEPPRNGRFYYDLDYNNEYRLVFKRPGFFQKIIIISTYVPNEVLQRNAKFPPLSFELNFFKETDIIDQGFTIKPVARVFYNSKIDNFDSEIYLSDQQLREQIQAARAEQNALAAEHKNISKADEMEQAALEKQYSKLVADADALYHKTNYDEAISKFREALMLFSQRPYPRDRIAEIEDLLAALKLKNEAEQNYLAAIKAGDTQFTATQYNGAIGSYQEALRYKAKDKYATDRIAEANRLLKEQAGNQQYAELIARADGAFNGQLYPDAKTLYLQAIDLRPRDAQYPRDQVKKIDTELARLAQLKASEAQYAEAMSKGNASFQTAAFPAALTSFKLALSLKPGDGPAQNRIADTEAAMLAAANQQKYNELVARADKQFEQKQLNPAKESYQQALAVKPAEQHPKERIAEIDRQLNFNQTLDNLLAEANNNFNLKNYTTSRTNYQQVLAMQATHELAKNRLSEIDKILGQQAIDEQYAAAIASADKAFDARQYDLAKGGYQQALTIKANEKYPQSQLAKIDEALKLAADQAAREQQYLAFMQQGQQAFAAYDFAAAVTAYQGALAAKANDVAANARLSESRERQNRFYQALQQADAAFDRKQFAAAKPFYQQALEVIPPHEKSKLRIAEIDKLLAQQDLEKQYADMLAAADQAFSSKQYQPAKSGYQQALSLKPAESYPKEQIQKIDTELARLSQLDADYNKAIKEGDRLVGAVEYPGAIGQYQQALKLKPGEPYPAEQIEKVKQLQTDQLRAEQTDRNYRALVAKGDSLFKLTNYLPAKTTFADASRLRPEQKYPKDKIAEIDAILAELAHQKEVQAEVQRAYLAAVKRGDDAFRTKDFDNAASAYNEAHLLKTDETYPVTQLAEIERQKALALEQAYKAAIARADGFFNKNDFTQAKLGYEEALQLKNSDSYATAQLVLIDQRLKELAQAEANRQKLDADYAARIAEADQAFAAQNYNGAKPVYLQASALKPTEKYPVDQVAKIDNILKQLAEQADLDTRYNQAMNSAREAFAADQLDNALGLYTTAQGLKPTEPEPPQRIAEINRLKNQRAEEARLLAAAEAQRLAAEKAARDNYQSAIALGDAAMNQKAYPKAQTAYQDALRILPEEVYPKNKLSEIDGILKQLAADELVRKQKAREDSLAQANLVAFNLKIQEAESFKAKTQYENAIGSYRQAISILPEKAPTVQPKITELESLIAQMAKLETDYKAAINQGDQQFAAEQLDPAKLAYETALGLKPNETYPKAQIEKINQRQRELEVLAEQARSAEKLNAAYNEAIAIADENFNKQDYQVAQFYYNKALGIQPQQAYPKQQLDKIKQLIDQMLTAEQLKAYNDAITKADTEFDRKGYTLARFHYNKALEIKSWEQYPKDRIQEIGKLTNSLLSQREEQDYLNWVNTADEAFVNRDFAVARSYYQRALNLKKDEPYPSIKLAEIQQELERVQAGQSEKDYRDTLAEADKAFEAKNFSVARFYYNKALSMRPNETYPKNQLQLIREALGGN
ncbi:MAG: hypothetical protein ACK5JD_13275 [Mangrovibacterium sp.]